MRRPTTRIAAALTALLIATLASVAPVGAWANGPAAGGVEGNGYGTHDWIIDQALRTFGRKPPAWFDATAAKLVSDDPDTLWWRKNEHVYFEQGYGRGAVHQIVEYYDKAVTHLRLGDAKRASEDIGLLAHFYADILNPFHAAYAGGARDSAHSKYEHLVDDRNRTPSSAPEWQTADRSPENVTNIRTKAIAAASYARGKYSELYKEFSKDETTLNTRVRQITGYLLTKASRELGDIINSVGKGIGNSPAIVKITVSRKYSQPSSVEYQGFTVKVTDSKGRPLQGVRVDVTFPSSADVPDNAEPTAHVFRAYTMPDGIATARAYIDLSKHGVAQTVKVSVTSRGKTLTATTTYTAK